MSYSVREALLGKSTAGKTRVCPHCRSTILDSSSVCPACNRYLRFEQTAAQRPVASLSPLHVAGTIRHPNIGDPWEYSVVLTVRNEDGEEISRQVVGVGALRPNEQRTFDLAVEIFCTNPPGKK
ncbi:MAG: hypothetical protein L6Q83_05375 [Gammaproteobacteria bacterium]|nr:hypothetical protein [Gammaproteobacteria bacterium]